MELIREWALAAAVLFITLAARGAISTFLGKADREGKWALAGALAPSISNLIYILGLYIFSEIAPLNPRIQVWLDNGIYVVAVIFLLGMVRRAAMIGIEWSSARSSNSHTLQLGFIPLIRNVITIFVFIAGSIMVLKRFNYDVLSLLTALGVGSLAVGLAAKDTLANMISGFTLIIDRNLRPGDRINLGGSVGDVEEIGIRTTRLRTGDGNTLIVPNSELVNTKILNLSLPSREKSTSTTIRVPHDTSFERVKAICLDLISQIEKAHPSRGKWVNLTQVTDGYLLITIGFWLREMDDNGAALSDLHSRLLNQFKKEGISLYSPPASLSSSVLTTGSNP